MRVGVLGELRVQRDGREVSAPNGMPRRLLLMLLADASHGIDDDTLIARLWPEGAPPNAVFSLRNQIARIRKLVGAELIVRTSDGYRVDRSHCIVDVDEFDADVARCRDRLRSDDPPGAIEMIDIALGRVRGPAFAEVREERWALRSVRDVNERVWLAEELWAASRLRCGQVGRELERLRRAALAQPQREIRWQQLVEAATISGRRAEALRAVQEARRALGEFGILPGPGLLEAEQGALH